MTKDNHERSPVIKRSIVIGGHKTSVSLEDLFWISLKDISKQRSLTLSKLVAEIDERRGERANLSSAIRLFVLSHYRKATSPEGKPTGIDSRTVPALAPS